MILLSEAVDISTLNRIITDANQDDRDRARCPLHNINQSRCSMGDNDINLEPYKFGS